MDFVFFDTVLRVVDSVDERRLRLLMAQGSGALTSMRIDPDQPAVAFFVEWIDGEALRIEYDSKADKVELFVNAKLNRDKDEVRGNYISYESRTEFFLVQDSKDQQLAARPLPGKAPERVRMVIQPKPKPPAGGAAPAASLQLEPTQTLPNPR